MNLVVLDVLFQELRNAKKLFHTNHVRASHDNFLKDFFGRPLFVRRSFCPSWIAPLTMPALLPPLLAFRASMLRLGPSLTGRKPFGRRRWVRSIRPSRSRSTIGRGCLRTR